MSSRRSRESFILRSVEDVEVNNCRLLDVRCSFAKREDGRREDAEKSCTGS